MSTLKVSTIQNISAAHGSTPEQIAQGRAKAWVNFNGTGTIAIRDSFNVSSITDNGTGTTTVTLASAMPSDDFVVCANSGSSSSDALRTVGLFNSFSTTTFKILTLWVDGAPNYARDDQIVCCCVFGDQA
tara:strand:- start:486 stop:875 length:390 start_codon:yes stop_codon:yes gene_type:complete